MNQKSKALINYYVRLIEKGTYTIADVPENLQHHVTRILAEAKAVEADKDVKPE